MSKYLRKKISGLKRWVYFNYLTKEDTVATEKRYLFYKEFVSAGDLVFDVGANIGNRIYPFLKLDTKIVAIEPQVKCIKLLKRKFGVKVFYEQVGVADREGTLDLHISDMHTLTTFSQEFIDTTTSSGRFSMYKWDKNLNVTVTTLDKLIAKYGVPQFIKIDTEGFEYSVIKGLTRPVKYISFEYTLPELSQNLEKILHHLGNEFHGITVNFSVGEKMELALKHWIDIDKFLSLLTTNKTFINSMGKFGDVYVDMTKCI